MIQIERVIDSTGLSAFPEWWQGHTFRAFLRFEEHVVFPRNYAERKNQLTSDLRDNLDATAINIVFTENMLGTRQHEETFKRGLKQFKSFAKAEIYAQLMAEGLPNPSEDIIMQHLDVLANGTDSNPRLAYRLMVRQVLDEFSSEGYRIQPALEISDHLKPKYPVVPGEVSHLHLIELLSRYEDRKQVLAEHISLSRSFYTDRNQVVARQLADIKKKANNQPRVTLSVLMGTLHSDLVDLAAPVFRGEMMSSSQTYEELELSKSMQQMFYALAGLDVPVEQILSYKK